MCFVDKLLVMVDVFCHGDECDEASLQYIVYDQGQDSSFNATSFPTCLTQETTLLAQPILITAKMTTILLIVLILMAWSQVLLDEEQTRIVLHKYNVNKHAEELDQHRPDYDWQASSWGDRELVSSKLEKEGKRGEKDDDIDQWKGSRHESE